MVQQLFPGTTVQQIYTITVVRSVQTLTEIFILLYIQTNLQYVDQQL